MTHDINSTGYLPTFIVGGAGKSGTTSVDQVLRNHPDVGMATIKEPCYFCWEDLPRDRNQLAVKSLAAYKALFSDYDDKVALGEVSPHYLGRPSTPRRIKDVIPHCKLIFVLRNPIERAYSLYLHLRRDGAEERSDFFEALQNSRFAWNYKDEGLYGLALKRYMDLFEREQIGIFFYDDLVTRRDMFFSDLFDFIGVPYYNLNESLRVKRNVSGIPQSSMLRLSLKLLASPGVRASLRKYSPTKIRETGTRWFHNWMAEDLIGPAYPERARDWLINYYKSDIDTVAAITSRDVRYWLEYEDAKV